MLPILKLEIDSKFIVNCEIDSLIYSEFKVKSRYKKWIYSQIAKEIVDSLSNRSEVAKKKVNS